ncbi:RHS repeat-associated core domain containing protein [Nitzschia inconspicua]|uniref:RHS repeat-associated core domain containing protein n=1 Tax=Nitzschia inconspicua TaxID=303405 RepID=A0A9K3LIP2_9STRA|nr:RHS repeat-associated core domain containing protein [Nitzschia inconspicua]
MVNLTARSSFSKGKCVMAAAQAILCLLLLLPLVVAQSDLNLGRDDTSSQTSQQLLSDLFQATSGVQWSDSSNWNQGEDICRWKGITCYNSATNSDTRRNGHIQAIDLSSNRLVGTIPASIFSLPYLETFNVENNPDVNIALEGLSRAQFLKTLIISKTAVTSLADMAAPQSLESFFLQDLKLTGPIPEVIFTMSNLISLHANDNSFTGTLPSAFGELSKLEELTLFDSDLTGQLPTELGKLTLLKILRLTDNAFGGTLPTNALEQLSNLQTLSIQRVGEHEGAWKGPGITGSLPVLQNHPFLTKVQFENQKLSGSINPNFLKATSAGQSIEVDLRNNEISRNIPASLATKRFLSLYLGGNQITSVPAQIYDRSSGSCEAISDWMNGDVARFGCNAFLCPPGTWAPQGRAMSGDTTCQSCGTSADVWGVTECSSSLTNVQREREILLNFYNVLNGRNWMNDDGWLELDQNVCEWHGIECDSSTGRVTSIILRNNKLSGTVPSDLFEMPRLQVLNLESNEISFDFASVSKATNLQSLDLTSIGLESLAGIANLMSLPNLTYLSVASNKIVGTIPEALFSISQLEELDLSHNEFSGPLSPLIGGMTNLKRFSVDDNSLTGQLPAEIGNVATLQEFSAAENEFAGTLPSTLNNLNNLQKLDLGQKTGNGSGIGGPLLAFANLGQLTTLKLDSNNLTGSLPANFLVNSRHFENPITVGLSHNKFSGSIPEGWSRFDQLTVDLTGNMISQIPSSLCGESGWMNGAVEQFQCDAILCPAGTYNNIGRRTDTASTCLSCPGSVTMGATFCGSEGTTDESAEINILLRFFSETGGSSWTNNDGWYGSMDYCNSFFGVECDGAGRVTSLNLAENNLRGTVPSSIFKLENLRELVLSGNPVVFSFQGIADADKLVSLYLDDVIMNSLDGIGDAKNLQVLNLAGNNLEGTVPIDLYLLTSLKKLDLGYNFFSGRLNNIIGAMTSLESLHLYHNQFTGRIPAAIGDLVNLQELNLAENPFDGTIPPQLNELVNLRFLSIQRGGGILGTSDVGINQGMTSLQGVGLTGTLPAFDNLKYIEELYLGVNGITGSIPFNFLDGVEDKTSAIKVDLTSNAITGTIPASLTKFERMSLFLGGNRIIDIADGICSKSQWMGGDVGSHGCDAILCPTGTYSAIGREGSGATCEECGTDTSGFLGRFVCLSSSEVQEGSERDILELLYNSMDGPHWLDNTNWLDPDVSICNWYGIQCISDSEDSVASINLSNNRLSNAFPSEVYDLPNLLEINLQGNDIVYSFNGIGRASNLEALNLAETGLTSLTGITQARNLKLLRLDGNNFPLFPDEVLDLTLLEVLSLSENLFPDEVFPSGLQFLTSLTYFACSGCGFNGPLPDWLSSFPNLQYLKLSQNALSGSIPASLETVVSLKHLDLSDQAGGGLNGPLPSFASMGNLTEIYLQHNYLEGPIPSNFLSSVPNTRLVTVDLRHNGLNETIPAQLANFNRMNLYVANNLFTGIPQALCSKNWNDGDVAANGCDGLICSEGTFNAFGRATKGIDCFECDDPFAPPYLGSTYCGSAVEHQALVFLYRFFGGPNWKSDNNWMRSDDHCTWQGITCYNSGDLVGLVQKIELPNNNLIGTMPFGLLWQMVGLNYVDLSQNDISIPFSLVGGAINLETIKLSETAQSSLEGLEESQTLKSLHLTSSNFTGTIPQQIYALTSLEELYMSHNDMSGSISFQIGDLKQLKDLYLFGNKLGGTIPTELGYLARLEHLSLGNNRFVGSIPRQITSLPVLQFLSLENESGAPSENFASAFGLSGPLPAFDGLPLIEELYMAHNAFTGTLPEHFLQGVHDKDSKIMVDLTFNKLQGAIPASLSGFQNMNLLLAGNEITEIASEVCNSIGWMNGEVAQGCDAILCPPGSFNPDGRRVDPQTLCEPCTFPGSARTFGSTSCGPGNAASLDDRSILFELYDATDGSSWINSNGWKSDSPYCDWYGVTCGMGGNGERQVVELNLSENNLNGIVPSIVYHLDGLNKLDLRKNPVSISFIGIEAASNLKELYLDETLINSLNGIGRSTALEILHLHKNAFRWQPINEELFDVSSLTELNLSDSMFSGTLSAKIGTLVNLERLILNGNAFNGNLPPELGQLNGLKELDLSDNNWIGTLPSAWSGMTALEALFIVNAKSNRAGVSGPLLPFSSMPNLRDLHLGQNQLTGTIPSAFLSGVSNSGRELNVHLQQNHLIGTVPSSLAFFTQLNIDLSDNLFVAIGDGLCGQSGWNGGNVGRFGCDAILCPAGEYSRTGRQTSAQDACQTCPGDESSPYLGITTCLSIEKKREREILGLLYQATNGANWILKDGWMEDGTDICTWSGITCQEASTIETISLGSNHLVGSIPKEIFDLPNLKTLSLYSNPIQFSFEGIGKATSLEILSLDSTNIKTLSGIGAGLSLVEVNVRFNQLSGPLPVELDSLTNLEVFSASFNGLSGPIPEFSSLRKLNALRLSDNSFTGTLPAFSRQPDLKSLDLSDNQLVGSVPSNFLANVLAVNSLFLDLSNNMLTGTVPGNLTRFNDVTIYLRDNRFDGINGALCEQGDWNGGDVASYQCDGILCPAGTYSVIGRASESGSTCEKCDLNSFFGGSRCGGSSDASFPRNLVFSIFFLVTTTFATLI